jgi:hypothetical protein
MSPCHGEDRGFESPMVRQLRRCSSVVEHQPSKLVIRVRFPPPAPAQTKPRKRGFFCFYQRGQLPCFSRKTRDFALPPFQVEKPWHNRNTMKKIKEQTLGGSRPLYHQSSLALEGILFGGNEPGESPLNECKKCSLSHCSFEMPYGVWNCSAITLDHVTFSKKARSPLWYNKAITMSDVKIYSDKAVRECYGILLKDVYLSGDEAGWKCHDIDFNHCIIQTQYLLFCSVGVKMEKTNATGPNALQYIEKGEIHDSVIVSEDAFLHCKNVTIYDSDLTVDYLGWYSTDLKLVRCKIRGAQPLCYCHNLTLEDCVMEGCQEAFEYSDIIKATIKGSIKSIKDPDKGIIEADHIDQIIQDVNRRDTYGKVTIIERDKIKP